MVARVALGVIALHVVDDNFLQPEPGTTATGHLLSGLVPLAVIGCAAAVYGRLRPGFRAVLALVFGVLGVVAGTEAAYYTANGGASGDDYTGYLSVAAGLLLLGVGSATLWRSRRRDDGRLWRYVRRLLLTAAAAVAFMFVLFPISLAYVVTHTARAEVPRAELGAAYENVEFTTSDGLRLKGWYVPSKNRAAVIAFPGRSGPQKQARMLARHGYGVLLFDRRGEGGSEGDPNVFGWGGERDLDAAAAYLRSRPDVDDSRIGSIGLSVGGEMLIHAAAHSDAFNAIVSEGASGQSLRDELANPRLSERLLDLPTQASLTTAVSAVQQRAAAAESEERGRQYRADAGVLHLRRAWPGRHGDRAEQGVLRGRARQEADLGGARRPTRRRHHDASRRSTSAASSRSSTALYWTRNEV